MYIFLQFEKPGKHDGDYPDWAKIASKYSN